MNYVVHCVCQLTCTFYLSIKLLQWVWCFPPAPPNIAHLGFTHGPNLTCISTGSPATTVTWMRDGQQLSLSDTYIPIQTVTDRRLSTYNNILVIKAASSDIIGHTYSCTVINAFGTVSKALVACKFHDLEYLF